MRALVTGGHGFIGSHLVRRLLAEGTTVRCLLRRPGTPASLAGLEVETARGDLTDAPSLEAAVEGVDEVYHLAALLTARSRREMLRTNAGGTRSLLLAARRSGGLTRFVHCSSLAVCGPSGLRAPLDETAPHGPVTWYGESKAAAERLVRACGAEGLPYTIVRPPVVYGPRDRGLLSVFSAVSKGFLPLLGVQPKRYSWVYGDDLAAALLVLGRAEATRGRTYFATGPEATMEAFLALVAEALGRRGVRVRVPDALLSMVATVADHAATVTGRPGMLTRDKLNELRPRGWTCSGEAARADAGFVAGTSLRDGVFATARWYREHGWL